MESDYSQNDSPPLPSLRLMVCICCRWELPLGCPLAIFCGLCPVSFLATCVCSLDEGWNLLTGDKTVLYVDM